MAHELAEPSPAVRRPVTITGRYACECANREVLTLAVVLDLHAPEWVFLDAMRRLRNDLIKEVRQHVDENPPAPDPNQKPFVYPSSLVAPHMEWKPEERGYWVGG